MVVFNKTFWPLFTNFIHLSFMGLFALAIQIKYKTKVCIYPRIRMKSHESLIMVTKSQNISANFSVVFRDTKVVKYKVQSLKQTKEQSEAVAWVNILSTIYIIYENVW